MNPELEFARKTALAYNALCQPLCQELNLPQTAFDILMFLGNNPSYKTASDIVEYPAYQSQSCFGKCGPAGPGRLSYAAGGQRRPAQNGTDLHRKSTACHPSRTEASAYFL